MLTKHLLLAACWAASAAQPRAKPATTCCRRPTCSPGPPCWATGPTWDASSASGGRAGAALVQVLVLPSFEPEYMLSVEHTGPQAYTLTYRKAQKSIWYSSRPKTPANVTFLNQRGVPVAPPQYAAPAASDSVSTVAQRVALTPALAQALADLFSVALAQTRYSSEQFQYVDGTEFTFIAYPANMDVMSGVVHSPKPDTNMGALAGMVAELRELATATDNLDFRQGVLLSEAQALLFRLAAR